MKTLKEIREGFFNEGFFNNVGSMSPSLWLSKLKYAKPFTYNKYLGEQWAKEYLYKIDGSKLILMHDNDKYVFDFAKSLLWMNFVKFCDPADEYIFTFSPAHGQIHFTLHSKKRWETGPAVYIDFNKDMSTYQMRIKNTKELGIDEKLYKSKGYTTEGYIFNRELIKYFIG